MSNRIKEIDIAKGIGILLVIVGHSIPDANIGIENSVACWIFNWIYSFHMGLFMAMSGFLFYRKAIESKSFLDKLIEIRKRFVRIMLPYLTFSFMIFFAKLFLSTWSRKPVNLHTIVEIIFGTSPCGNMWFLWTLFVLSLIMLFIPKSNNFPHIIFLVSIILYFMQSEMAGLENFGVDKIVKMGIWFVVGMELCKYQKYLFKLRKSNSVLQFCEIGGLLGIQILFLKHRTIVEGTIGMLFVNLILVCIGIGLMLLVSFFISRFFYYISNVLAKLGADSMILYVLSYIVQTPGVTLYAKMNGLGIPYIIWVLFLAIGSIVFAELTAKFIIRKNKVLKLIILGEYTEKIN